MAFRSAAMEDLPRLLHYINVHSFMVTSNRSEVRHKHAAFIYMMLNKLGNISLPKIFLEMVLVTSKDQSWRYSLPFPALITRICLSHSCPVYDADRRREPLGLLTKDNISKMLTYARGKLGNKRQRPDATDRPEVADMAAE